MAQETYQRGHEIAEELQRRFDEEHEKSGSLNKALHSPLTNIGLNLSKVGLLMGVKSISNSALREGQDPMDTVAPMLAAGLAPLTLATTLIRNKNTKERLVDYKRREGEFKNDPNKGAIKNLMGLGKTSMGALGTLGTVAATGLGAVGALTGSPGLMGASYDTMAGTMATKSPAMALKVASGLGLTNMLGQSLDPMGHSAAMGAFEAYKKGIVDSGGNALSTAYADSILGQGAAGLPSTLGYLGAGALKGVGAATTGVGGFFGSEMLKSLGSTITGAGSSVASASSALHAMALSNPLLGGLLTMGTMMLLQKPMAKMQTAIKEKVTGKVEKTGKMLRPLLKPISELIKRYSSTRMIDTQILILGNNNQLTPYEWLSLTIMSAIEKPVSLIGWWVEQEQLKKDEKRVGSNILSNSFQSKYDFSGKEDDFTKEWEDPEERLKNLKLFSRDYAEVISGNISKWALDTEKGLLKAGAIINPLNHVLGFKSSAYAKIKDIEKKEQKFDLARSVSQITGIPTSGIVAMETTATTLMNLGDSIEEKALAIAGGTYELIRTSTIFLADIRGAMGITKKNSFFGKLQQAKDKQEKTMDQRSIPRQFGEGFIKALAHTPVLGILGGLIMRDIEQENLKSGRLVSSKKAAKTAASSVFTPLVKKGSGASSSFVRILKRLRLFHKSFYSGAKNENDLVKLAADIKKNTFDLSEWIFLNIPTFFSDLNTNITTLITSAQNIEKSTADLVSNSNLIEISLQTIASNSDLIKLNLIGINTTLSGLSGLISMGSFSSFFTDALKELASISSKISTNTGRTNDVKNEVHELNRTSTGLLDKILKEAKQTATVLTAMSPKLSSLENCSCAKKKKGMAEGGLITGPSTPYDSYDMYDLIYGDKKGMTREYIVNKESTQNNLAILEEINNNKKLNLSELFSNQISKLEKLIEVAQVGFNAVVGKRIFNISGSKYGNETLTTEDKNKKGESRLANSADAINEEIIAEREEDEENLREKNLVDSVVHIEELLEKCCEDKNFGNRLSKENNKDNEKNIIDTLMGTGVLTYLLKKAWDSGMVNELWDKMDWMGKGATAVIGTVLLRKILIGIFGRAFIGTVSSAALTALGGASLPVLAAGVMAIGVAYAGYKLYENLTKSDEAAAKAAAQDARKIQELVEQNKHQQIADEVDIDLKKNRDTKKQFLEESVKLRERKKAHAEIIKKLQRGEISPKELPWIGKNKSDYFSKITINEKEYPTLYKLKSQGLNPTELNIKMEQLLKEQEEKKKLEEILSNVNKLKIKTDVVSSPVIVPEKENKAEGFNKTTENQMDTVEVNDNLEQMAYWYNKMSALQQDTLGANKQQLDFAAEQTIALYDVVKSIDAQTHALAFAVESIKPEPPLRYSNAVAKTV